jgi:hypothetical protein
MMLYEVRAERPGLSDAVIVVKAGEPDGRGNIPEALRLWADWWARDGVGSGRRVEVSAFRPMMVPPGAPILRQSITGYPVGNVVPASSWVLAEWEVTA